MVRGTYCLLYRIRTMLPLSLFAYSLYAKPTLYRTYKSGGFNFDLHKVFRQGFWLRIFITVVRTACVKQYHDTIHSIQRNDQQPNGNYTQSNSIHSLTESLLQLVKIKTYFTERVQPNFPHFSVISDNMMHPQSVAPSFLSLITNFILQCIIPS